MIKRISSRIFADELFKDGAILFIGTLIASGLNFLFHFYAGRVLGPSDYGVFSALLAIVYLGSVATNTVQTGITNIVARFSSKDATPLVKDLAIRAFKKLAFIGVISTLILLALS